MAANTGERTLIAAIIPPGTAHINGVFSVGTRDDDAMLVDAAVSALSLVSDAAVRAAPKSGIYQNVFYRLPLAVHPVLRSEAHTRIGRLQCATSAFGDLWSSLKHGADVAWSGGLDYPGRRSLSAYSTHWTPEVLLRRASDRRQAQLEIDAIVALSLDITADELCTIYRTQFAVLYGYDRNTYFYDTNGRLVPNEVLKVWKQRGDAISKEERTATNASGNTYEYELPFVTLDREADMRQAYAHFEKILQERS